MWRCCPPAYWRHSAGHVVAEDSDDDMPPLDFVGIAPGNAGPKNESAAKQSVASDDSMPTLDYVGASLRQGDDESALEHAKCPSPTGKSVSKSVPAHVQLKQETLLVKCELAARNSQSAAQGLRKRVC